MIKLNDDVVVRFQLENYDEWEQQALLDAFNELCSTTNLYLQLKSDRLLITGGVNEVANATNSVKQKIEEYKPK